MGNDVFPADPSRENGAPDFGFRAFLHGCISTPIAALLPAIPVSMAGKGQEEGRGGTMGMEGSIGIDSRAGSRGAAAWP